MNERRRSLRNMAAMLVLGMLAAACGGEAADVPGTIRASSEEGTIPVGTVTVETIPAGDGVARVPSGDLSGNRYLPGAGALTAVEPVDVSLAGSPTWVVGVDTPDGMTWVVTLEDGSVEAWRVDDAHPVRVDPGVDRLPPGTPPLVIGGSDGIRVVAPPEGASPLALAVPLPGGGIASISDDGSVVVAAGDEARVFDIDALPDARLGVSAEGLISVPAEATTRYEHGILADEYEAGRVVVIDPVAEEVVGEAVVSAPDVIEGIAAPWVDVDGDGDQEILVTVSNVSTGARLVVFDERGGLVAEGPPIGRGNRWRNQLGAAPLGPDGEVEVVDVRVPHIGGVVEFFRLEEGRLIRVAEIEGFTSHTIASRNLDMALAADVDGDGRVEVLVPTQDRTELGVVRRTADGVEVAGRVGLPGALVTNLAAGRRDDGSLSFAAGTDEGVLRIWSAG